MVERATPIPIYLQIEEKVRGLVNSGELRPLDKLPSENELAERFDVSRMTVRKSLDRLVGEGVLFRQPGRGTFVAPPKIGHGISTSLSFSAAMESLGLRHDTKVLEADTMLAPENIGPALGQHAGSMVVFIRRLRSVEDEPAALHTSYLPMRFSAILEKDLTGSLMDLMINVGARVARSRDTVESVSATGEDALWLEVPEEAPLIRIEGLATSIDQQPLRYTEALYRGDRFRFSCDIRDASDLRLEIKSLRQ